MIVLTDRQKMILKIVIEEYINIAKPIGSKLILSSGKINSSPATIRNECSLLEKKGLLLKNHSSSGRIPSTKGYRYYIDELMKNKDNNIDSIKQKIEKLFINRNLAIDDILDETSKILSKMTHLTTLVIGPNIKKEKLKKIDLLPLNKEKAVVIITLSNGHVENQIFNFSRVSLKELSISVKLFNERLENTLISELPTKFSLIKPILENQVKKHEYIFKQFITTIANFSKIKKTTNGIQYMLQNPEFNDSKSIKKAIKLIESISSFEFFHKMNNNITNGRVNIKIGNEIENNEFDNISLISTKYKTNNEKEEGQLALIGPKRIEYNKMIDLLEWISKKINNYNDIGNDNNDKK